MTAFLFSILASYPKQNQLTRDSPFSTLGRDLYSSSQALSQFLTKIGFGEYLVKCFALTARGHESI